MKSAAQWQSQVVSRLFTTPTSNPLSRMPWAVASEPVMPLIGSFTRNRPGPAVRASVNGRTTVPGPPTAAAVSFCSSNSPPADRPQVWRSFSQAPTSKPTPLARPNSVVPLPNGTPPAVASTPGDAAGFSHIMR